MTATFRHFASTPGFSEDFNLVRGFLVRNYANVAEPHSFPWGRWEWAFSLPYLDETNISRIGIWEAEGRMVGLATYEDKLGSAYVCWDKKYSCLKHEMLSYAVRSLAADGKLRVLIPDTDPEFQEVAANLNFMPSESRDYDAVYHIDLKSIEYTLPDGFKIIQLSNGYDIKKYGSVLWRGFNHPGEVPDTELEQKERLKSLMGGPHSNLALKIAAVSPGGDYVSYCGMWYEVGTENALVEPVATDPTYRLKGLGRAVVLEGIRQCGILGAKRAYVGSSQQFYYSIGFRPSLSSTWWVLKRAL